MITRISVTLLQRYGVFESQRVGTYGHSVGANCLFGQRGWVPLVTDLFL